MGQKLDEGLLYDLFTKRRAGQFTGDELLWAADHPKVIRWAMKHPKEAEGLCERPLATVKRELSPSERLAADLIPAGWTVVDDVAPTLKSASDLEAIGFLREGESAVSGETMRARAKEIKVNLGLADLAVAMNDKAKISAELRPYCLVFSGTVLRGPDGSLCVACLDWGVDGWYRSFYRVACVWSDLDRLVRGK